MRSMPPLQPIQVGPWAVAFHSDVAALVRAGHVAQDRVALEHLKDGVVAPPTGSAVAGLGELFVDFFHYYGYEFDFRHQSVRRGRAVRRPARLSRRTPLIPWQLGKRGTPSALARLATPGTVACRSASAAARRCSSRPRTGKRCSTLKVRA